MTARARPGRPSAGHGGGTFLPPRMSSGVDCTGSPPPAPPLSAVVSVSVSPRDIDRDIWAMAWPAMLSLIVVNLVDIVDVALVGRLGRQTVAAWGYAAQCVHLVETLIQAVGIACVALVARAVGARNPGRARRALAASMFVAESVAAVGFLLALLVPRQIPRVARREPGRHRDRRAVLPLLRRRDAPLRRGVHVRERPPGPQDDARSDARRARGHVASRRYSASSSSSVCWAFRGWG